MKVSRPLKYQSPKDQALYDLGAQTARAEIETPKQAKALSKSRWTFKGRAHGFFSILEGDDWAHGYIDAVGRMLREEGRVMIIKSKDCDIAGAPSAGHTNWS